MKATRLDPRLETIVLWWIGDQFNHGSPEFRSALEKAVSEFGYTDKTLEMARWMSRLIPQNERHPALTWNHHMKVAKLPVDERRYWLDQAEKRGLSTRALGSEIKSRASNSG